MTPQDQQMFESAPLEKDGRVLVQSRCVLCGFTVIGSIVENLLDQQQQHLQSAHPKVRPAVSAE